MRALGLAARDSLDFSQTRLVGKGFRDFWLKICQNLKKAVSHLY